MNKARIAVARKLAVILHQMWTTGEDFRWSNKGNETEVAAAKAIGCYEIRRDWTVDLSLPGRSNGNPAQDVASFWQRRNCAIYNGMPEFSKLMMSASDVSTSERTMQPAGSSTLSPEPTGCLGTQTGLKPICPKKSLARK